MRTRNTPKILTRWGTMIGSASQAIVRVGRSRRLIPAFSQYGPRLAAISLLTFLVLSSLTSSNPVLWRTPHVSAFSEAIGTFASNGCTTPKTDWDLGGTACAVATDAPDDRRIAWVAPNGAIAKLSSFFAGTASDSYTIPTGSDPFAQVGTWAVETIDVNGVAFATAKFVVRDPANASVDLSVGNFGQFQASAGNNVSYRVEVVNRGPDGAQGVALTSSVPGGTTFLSATQNSGPVFTCTVPAVDSGTGTISCTIDTLAADATAIFTFAFNVDAGTPNGATVTSTASISSTTNELHQPDNSASTTTTIVGATTTCTVNCPTVTPVSTTQCSAVVTYSTPTTSGSCGSSSEGGGGVVCSPPSGSAFPVGSTTVTCTAATGDTCGFNVTVQSTGQANPLTITCPSNVTVNSDNISAGTAIVSYPAPTATGNCVTVSCVPPSGSSFSLGTTGVTCTATDSSGSTTCSFNVTLNDASGGGCTLTCPGDVTQPAAAGQCSAVVNYPVPITSGCGTVSCSPAAGSTFQVGATVVTCTSTAGSDCEFTVIVVPPSAPAITTCATDKTISANADCEAAIPNLVNEVVATGCSVTVSQSPAPGSLVGPGSVTVTLTAENSAGEVICTATVTVLNTVTPTLSCPADLTRSNEPDQCGALVTYVDPPSSNTCSAITVSCSPPSGSFFPIGATNILCTATDVSGNTATCMFKVTVNDNQLPTIACPANITHASDLDQCGAVITFASPTAADNCPGVATSCSPASGTQFPVGTTTVTCNATDAANNQATCSFTVTITDSEPPTITCSSNILVGAQPNSVVATVNYQTTVNDNCQGATTSCTPPSGSQFPIGTTTVTCNATDAAGNQATCSFSVTVSDQQPPTISCQAGITTPNDSNQCGAGVTYPAPLVTDNQPGATFSCTPVSGSTFPVGVTAVTCTATDAGGNQSTCSFAVTVTDTQLPVLNCPANITVPNATGQCSANVNPGAPTAADNCPGVTVAGVRSDGLALNAAYSVGTTTITWTARDAAGNQKSCPQTIIVNDVQAPSITGAAANPSTLWPPNHKMVDVTISYGVTDNCTPASAVNCDLTVSSDEPPDGGGDGHTSADWTVIDAHHVKLRSERSGTGDGRIYTITITCKDVSGNTSTQSVTVTVPHNQ